MSDGQMTPELDPQDVAIGFSAETMERKALALIGRPRIVEMYGKRYERVCERDTLGLPRGCWDDKNRSPYARWHADRWCDACICYAAMNGTLPRPTIQIEGKQGRGSEELLDAVMELALNGAVADMERFLGR